MQFSSLRLPDDSTWGNHPDYNPGVAEVLHRAYRQIGKFFHDQRRFERAWAKVLPLVNHLMSPQQRMHLQFLHAAAYVEGCDYHLAVHEIDRAEELAETLRDDEARADLIYLRGVADHGRSHFHSAVEDCEAYLRLVCELDDDSEVPDPVMDFDVRSRLASYQALTADFEGALRTSEEADRLVNEVLPPHSVPTSALGNLLLVRSHVLRLGAPPRLPDALECAVAATEVYRITEAHASLVRARTLVADIALDRAEVYSADRASDAFASWLDFAESYAERALILSGQINDESGAGLALLSQARVRLLKGANVDTRAQIHYVMRMARELDDPGLYAQALTALGHDLLGRRERESALGVYRAVLKRLRGNQIPMLAIIPRNALLRAYPA